MAYPFIIQGNNIVVVIDNKSHTISKSHITYETVLNAIKQNDWETVKQTIEPKEAIQRYSLGFVKIDANDGTFYWKDQPMHSFLTERIVQMYKEGFSVEPLVFFMENLMENPSKRAVDELYGFLEKNDLPITPDGKFLAYKKVRHDFTDCHTGTMDNSPGKVVSMERNQVCEDKDLTCSYGLHFCGESYLKYFSGDKTVIVKINPRDVVSIPSDYNEAKGRACRYEVIAEMEGEAKEAFTAPVQENANNVVQWVDV